MVWDALVPFLSGLASKTASDLAYAPVKGAVVKPVEKAFEPSGEEAAVRPMAFAPGSPMSLVPPGLYGESAAPSGAPATSNPKFAQLLGQERMKMLQQLSQDPSGWENAGRMLQKIGASQVGGSKLMEQQQAFSAQDTAKQSLLQQFLATETENQLRQAAALQEQLKNEGDEVAAFMNTVVGEDKASLGKLTLDYMPLIEQKEKELGVSEDEMPVAYRKDLIRRMVTENPDKYAPQKEPVTTSRLVSGTELGGEPGKFYEVQGYEDPQTGEFIQTDINSLGAISETNINLPGQEYISEYEKAAGKRDVETLGNVMNQGEIARQQKLELDRMRVALESGKFETGFAADPRVFIARMASYLEPGLLEDEQFQKWIGDDATGDTLDAATSRLVNLGIDEAGGRVTNLRIQFLKNALPALFRSGPANKILVEVMTRMADRDMAVAQIAESYDSGTASPGGERGPNPKDAPSYRQSVREYDKANPIITPEIEKAIREGTKGAPRSFKEVYQKAEKPPEGIPEGSKPTDRYFEGKRVWADPDGNEWVE